jgi:hypothetical protein
MLNTQLAVVRRIRAIPSAVGLAVNIGTAHALETLAAQPCGPLENQARWPICVLLASRARIRQNRASDHCRRKLYIRSADTRNAATS